MNEPQPSRIRDRAGTCIACFTPTDTGLAVIGNIAWLRDTLRMLGVPEDEALNLVHYTFDHRGVGPLPAGSGVMQDYEWVSALYNHDPDLIVVWQLRVCTRCTSASPAPFPTPALAIPGAVLPQVSGVPAEDLARGDGRMS
jgi:hypothetical protein